VGDPAQSSPPKTVRGAPWGPRVGRQHAIGPRGWRVTRHRPRLRGRTGQSMTSVPLLVVAGDRSRRWYQGWAGHRSSRPITGSSRGPGVTRGSPRGFQIDSRQTSCVVYRGRRDGATCGPQGRVSELSDADPGDRVGRRGLTFNSAFLGDAPGIRDGGSTFGADSSGRGVVASVSQVPRCLSGIVKTSTRSWQLIRTLAVSSVS
jgi:hypothetical protein